MRIVFTPLLALVPLSLGVLSPAMAASESWRQSCSGPEYVCGRASAPATSAAAKSATTKSVKKIAKAKTKSQAIASTNDAPAKPKKKFAAVKAKAKTEVTEAPVKTKPKAKVAKASSGGSAFQSGMASWYGGKFHGRTTANGEKYNMDAMTAAHKTLPFGTRVRVTNTRSGEYVDVRINDRGPFVGGRIIDLSRAAAGGLGMHGSGVAPVKVAILGKG